MRGSGMIRGIGPVYAKKMVKAFGDKVFDVIEAEPDRFTPFTRGACFDGSGKSPSRPSPAHHRLAHLQ
jgi:hypothetical protein